jgi:uncharacterized protein (TIGR00369 family)
MESLNPHIEPSSPHIEPVSPPIENRIRGHFSHQPLLKTYGASLSTLGKGFAEITLEPQDFLLRSGGLFHGGVITAIADSAGGYACGTLFETEAHFLTVELKINFLNPARGDRLVTRAKVLKSGSTLIVVQTDSYIEVDGQLHPVSTALLTFIVEKRP